MKALVISNMWPGRHKPNFGVFVSDRVDAYRRLGVDVSLAVNDDPRRGPFRTPWKYLRLLLRVLRSVAASRPQVIEAHYLKPTALYAWAAAAISRCPYVLYAHGSDIDAAPLLAASVRRAAEIHTNSKHSADRVRSAFGQVSVVVVPPGVDLDRFAPGTPERGVVTFVGDLVPHKGLDILLEAMTRLPSVTLRVIGDGPERRALEQHARVLGLTDRVEWVGQVEHEQVPAYLARAWVVAIPSRADALGQVAVEALASGIPVVVSDVGGLASVPDAENGTVVAPDDPESLAAGLNRWLRASEEERRAAGMAARRRAAEFEVNTVSARALARLEMVAGRKTSKA